MHHQMVAGGTGMPSLFLQLKDSQYYSRILSKLICEFSQLFNVLFGLFSILMVCKLIIVGV
jgi:non-ribosomal peptide synthetase component E (peptide arylation enzyme)